MATEHSGIEWTEATWNPTVGCTKVSPGCDRCYAERVTQRFAHVFPNGFDLTLRPESLELPLRWRQPRLIFVNSMSDLFHADVPEAFIGSVFDVMRRCPQHTFQVLTKRAERLARVGARLQWPDNVWMGVSVESPAFQWRVDYLRQIPAAIRFVSAEPLIESLAGINLTGIHWLIAGGESQPGCRPAKLSWFRELRDLCRKARVGYFLKQLGGHPSKRGGDEARLDGRLWRQWPINTDAVGPSGQSSQSSGRTQRRVGVSQRGASGTVQRSYYSS
jgi:protein gp37